MPDPTTTISELNTKIIGSFTGVNIMNILGWIALVILLIGGGWWAYVHYKNKREYNQRITAFKIVGDRYVPRIRDLGKTIRLGKGGFEIVYLKKAKTWKIAYGESIGTNDYYFFIMPDGYWYNGVLSARVNYIDERNGLIPVITTNPLMRGQYASLEKQIDSIHGEKQKWWDKYGTYVLSVAFILIAGVLLWLMFKEFHTALGQLSNYHTKLGELLDKMNNLASNLQTAGGTDSGLVSV